MKYKTLNDLLKADAVFIIKVVGIDFYEIRNDKYIVKNEKIIHEYCLDDTEVRGDDKKWVMEK